MGRIDTFARAGRPRAMFQRDKSDRLAYRFVDHVRGRRDDATRGPRRARDAWDAWDANVHWECGGESARVIPTRGRAGERERSSRESVVDAAMCGARVR